MLGWGVNAHGQLGLGPSLVSSFIPQPKSIPFFDNQICQQVVCSLTHSLFLVNDGDVYSAGNNEYSQLGREGRTTIPEIVNLPSNEKSIQIACGQSFSMCLTIRGRIIIWGSINGKINNDDGFFYQVPKYLEGLNDKRVIQIAAGYTHCLGLTDEGIVYAAGLNTHGQLGLGNAKDMKTAIPISCLRGSPIVQISCGGYHSLIISKSGTVFACGLNSTGQLGLGDTDTREWPSNIKGLQQQRAVYAACGEKHSVVVTVDGGVFSFGSGNHGQLGHNSLHDEHLPRKIMELMGSEVSQIACGRSHTIIYLPHTGQVSVFGLACAARSDTQITTVLPIPQKLPGEFLAYKTKQNVSLTQKTDSNSRNVQSQSLNHRSGQFSCQTSHEILSYRKIKENSTNAPKLQVIGVHAGGNQTFLRVTQNPISPNDHRIIPKNQSILELTLDFVRWLHQISSSPQSLEQRKAELSRMFSSETCLNGSFLALPDIHFRTSPTNPGIDVDQAIDVMEKFRSCDPIFQQILSERLQAILHSLPETAPCFEALRIYLVLPFCHLFEKEDMLETVIAPYAQATTRLRKNADGRVLDYWMLKMGQHFVERILEIYKPLVVKIVRIKNVQSPSVVQQYQTILQSILELLKKVHHVSCNMARPELVPHDTFYLKELNELINIQVDYTEWRVRGQNGEKRKILFCDYAFLFDLKAKITLLQYHGQLEMQEAMQNALMHNLHAAFLTPMEPVLPLLVLNVNRNSIVQDTINQLDKHREQDFKKPLKVFFQNEEGLDAGGVRKEFFLLLTKEILNPKYGMFTVYDETHTIWFSGSMLEEEESMFKLIGTLCALAVYNMTIIDLPFPLALYKKLLKKGKVDLDDMKSLSLSMYQSLKYILDYKEQDLEEALCYTFVIEREVYGEVRSFELKPGGSSISVNQSNKQEFVDLYIDFIFNKSCEEQFEAFSSGFRRVINSKPLELFYPDELMSFVIGNNSYDWNEFQRKTEYKGEYHANHPVIQWFWQVFHKLDDKEKKKFLLFLTGSDRVPVFGWSQTKPMTIQRSHADDEHLPVSHTCFNFLDLPSYSSKEILKGKLLEAIEHNQGFNLV